MRRTLGDNPLGGGGGGGGGSSPRGIALPVPPQTFCVFDGIPDPTVSTLGMDCAGINGNPDSVLLETIKNYFSNRGASSAALGDRRVAAQFNTLIARLRYECALLSTVTSYNDRVQTQVSTLQGQVRTLQGQVSLAQGQLNNCTTRAQGAENRVTDLNNLVSSLQGQISDLTSRLSAAGSGSSDSLIASLQGQVTDLTARLSAAVPSEIQTHIQTLESDLAKARSQITPTGLVVGGLVGAVGTYFAVRASR